MTAIEGIKSVIYGKTMIPYTDFTNIEIEFLRSACNFTDIESQYFNLRSRGKSNVQIAAELHISEPQVSKIAKKVKSKIFRVV